VGQQRRAFLPAASRDWLLPLYDPFVKLMGGEATRKKLVELAKIEAGQNVLEIGCGTGTVLMTVKRFHPDAQVTGLDPDPKALDRAKQKAHRSELAIRFDQGFSDQLPYSDHSFDRVLSSFMFHHLNEEEREQTLREARRVLRPGGSFYMADFEKGESESKLRNWFHSHHRLKDNSVGRVLLLLNNAGFADAKLAAHGHLLLFQVAYFEAVVPV